MMSTKALWARTTCFLSRPITAGRRCQQTLGKVAKLTRFWTAHWSIPRARPHRAARASASWACFSRANGDAVQVLPALQLWDNRDAQVKLMPFIGARASAEREGTRTAPVGQLTARGGLRNIRAGPYSQPRGSGGEMKEGEWSVAILLSPLSRCLARLPC
jgi:hypothetical protein